MLGFINNVTQMIIMTRGCVATKNHVANSKVQGYRPYLNFVYSCNKSLLYPAHNFVLHSGISKLHAKTSVVREAPVASLKVKIMI